MALVSGPTSLDRALSALWWVFLAGSGALFLAIAIGTLLYPHELVVSEAAVGMGIGSLLDGRAPYAASRFVTPPFVILHYTPLYYLIVAPVMAATKSLFAA